MVSEIDPSDPFRPRSRSSISDVTALLTATIDSIGKDIEKYHFRLRDQENARFIVTVLVFAIYSLIAIIFLQVIVDGGVQSTSPVFGEIVSKRIIIGSVLILSGFPILAVTLTRSVKLRRSVFMVRKHVSSRMEFAEGVLARVSSWERKYTGDYYHKSILRLRLVVLSQQIEEMREISDGNRSPE